MRKSRQRESWWNLRKSRQLHLSAAEALPLVHAAKQQGALLTAETCHHYLTLAAEEVPNSATQYKCCPPVRGQPNRELLWKALYEGELDMVVSDHSPCTPDLKKLEQGDFLSAWGGISSLQFGRLTSLDEILLPRGTVGLSPRCFELIPLRDWSFT
uniref:(California timema) hypothetical protein n=1 Tax=Timema californicum TaxID=61474 RepID=A0A7R9JFD4_TIMCA|nr:unnamed protein product [Timema californicum]